MVILKARNPYEAQPTSWAVTCLHTQNSGAARRRRLSSNVRSYSEGWKYEMKNGFHFFMTFVRIAVEIGYFEIHQYQYGTGII